MTKAVNKAKYEKSVVYKVWIREADCNGGRSASERDKMTMLEVQQMFWKAGLVGSPIGDTLSSPVFCHLQLQVLGLPRCGRSVLVSRSAYLLRYLGNGDTPANKLTDRLNSSTYRGRHGYIRLHRIMEASGTY